MTSARSHMGITGERTDEFRRRDPLDVSEMSNAQLGTAILTASKLFAGNSRHAAVLEEAAERLLRRRR